jgi:hypothetical protein
MSLQVMQQHEHEQGTRAETHKVNINGWDITTAE